MLEFCVTAACLMQVKVLKIAINFQFSNQVFHVVEVGNNVLLSEQGGP